MRRAAKVDGNHREITEALRAVGASVESLAAVGSGVPDLLCGYRGRTYLLEVKDGTAKDKRQRTLRPNQADWHAAWRGSVVAVVTSVEEALRAIGAVRAA